VEGGFWDCEELFGGVVAEVVVLEELRHEVGGEGVAGAYGVFDFDLAGWDCVELWPSR
jgi:hypothetical protein